MIMDLKELVKFLVKAKLGTYAGGGKEITPQRPGFRELEYSEGDWYYRDSYTGFYSAPGQELVKFRGNPVWIMSYSGGMNEKYHGDYDFAIQTFGFLKVAMLKIDESNPFRGPGNLKEGDWEYVNESEGDIRFFRGTEKILYKGEEVFRQHYIGGTVVQK